MSFNSDPTTFPVALTFDDVLLVPRYSEVLPRETDLTTQLTPQLTLSIPLISSAMDTVTESRLAKAMALAGGLGIIHKNLSVADQAEHVRQVKKEGHRVGAALGVGADRVERLRALVQAGADLVVIDTAHGHTKSVIEAVTATRAAFPDLPVFAGNVATAEGTEALIEAGASGVKVGIGPGSICTTRIVAGVGVPQFSAILECARVATERDVPIIADGGVRHSGDIVKALAAGASAVMIGSLFAGTDEAPGERVEVEGRAYRAYRGMGSLGAMGAGSADRYFQSGEGNSAKFVPEGVEGMVPARGPLAQVIHQLVGGVRAGFGYLGAKNLSQLRERARFVRVTPAGLREGHVHDLAMVKEAPNYQGR